MERGTSPVIGIVLLVAITVIAATTVGLAVSTTPPSPTPTATFDLSVDASSQQISITHERGDSIDLSEIDLQIKIEGENLEHQPPVPFFAATGFESGPTGVFNTASSDQWQVGQTASITVAATNDPQIESGDTVTVLLLTEQGVIAEVKTTA